MQEFVGVGLPEDGVRHSRIFDREYAHDSTGSDFRPRLGGYAGRQHRNGTEGTVRCSCECGTRQVPHLQRRADSGPDGQARTHGEGSHGAHRRAQPLPWPARQGRALRPGTLAHRNNRVGGQGR